MRRPEHPNLTEAAQPKASQTLPLDLSLTLSETGRLEHAGTPFLYFENPSRENTIGNIFLDD